MRDPRELAATVREALNSRKWVGRYRGEPGVPNALDALDALVAECREEHERRVGADAALEEMRRERDELFEVAQGQTALVNAAEALARRYEEAIRLAIEDVLLMDSPEGDSPRNIAANLRAALAEEKT